MIKYLKNNIYLIILIIISLVIFIPTFDIKFSWIDDGWDLLVSKNLIINVSHFDFKAVAGQIVESNIGRFRPVYWLWQTGVYIIGGSYSSVHYFLHYLLIISIVIIIYKFVNYFTKSNLSGFVAGLVTLVFPLNSENWVRLGPAEPIMIFFVLSSLYIYFTKRDLKTSIILMALGFLTKETAIAVAPAFIGYYLLLHLTNKNRNNTFKFMAWLIVLSLVSVTISMLNKKGYSNSYVFSFETAKYNFELYLKFIQKAFPVSIVLLSTFFIRNFRPIINFKLSKIKEIEIIKVFFLLLFFFLILIQAPWAWVLNRYLLPAIVMGSIFFGLEFYTLSKFFEKNKFFNLIFKTVSLIAIVWFTITASVKINEHIVRQKQSTNNIYLMLKKTAQVAPENGKVYFNFENNDATYEPLFESDLHFKLFFNRQDIKVEFLEDLEPNTTNYIVLSGSGSPLGSFKYLDDSKLAKDKSLKNSESYENNSSFVVLSDFKTTSKQIVKKTFNFVKNGEKFNSSGIYTDYLLKDYWSIYYY